MAKTPKLRETLSAAEEFYAQQNCQRPLEELIDAMPDVNPEAIQEYLNALSKGRADIFMINKSGGGGRGITVMTQGASERSDATRPVNKPKSLSPDVICECRPRSPKGKK